MAGTMVSALRGQDTRRQARRSEKTRGALPPPTIGQSVLVGWFGMRGLLTLATAFALPATFPQRDLTVLTAFAVVLATLVGQGPTLAPLIRSLGLGRTEILAGEMWGARTTVQSCWTGSGDSTALGLR